MSDSTPAGGENGILQVFVGTLVTAAFLFCLSVPAYMYDRSLLAKAQRRKSLLLANRHAHWVETKQERQRRGMNSSNSSLGPNPLLSAEVEASEEVDTEGVTLVGLFWQWNVESEKQQLLGRNAQVYLRFQKYVIAAMAGMTALCLVIVLPVNMTAPISDSVLHTNPNPSSSYINSTTPEFDRTTIRFAQVDERRMWAHVFCLLLLSAYSVYLFVRFQKQTILEEAQFKYSHRSLVARHSILLEGLPRKQVGVVDAELKCEARRVFGDHFVHLEVIPDIHKYVDEVNKLQDLQDAHDHYEAVKLRRKRKGTKSPDPLALVWFCRCKRAVAHFSGLIKEQKVVVQDTKRSVVDKSVKCSSRAVLILDSVESADAALKKRVGRENSYLYRCRRMPAPSGEDIQWRNAHIGTLHSWGLKFFWRSAFIVFVVFYSSPVALVTSFSPMANAKMWSAIESVVEWSPWLQGILTAYLPTLLLLIINYTLGPFIAYVVRFERQLTVTEDLRSCLVRYSIYLVLGTVVLPSLALSTVDAFLLRSETRNVSLGHLFQNIFLPGSGAFFLNYLLQAVFVSLSLNCTNFVDRLFRFRRLRRAESDKEIINSAGPLIFRTVGQYANQINIFTLVFVYCMYVPVMAPLGLAYAILKHLIDKYQLMNKIVGPTNSTLHSPESIKRLSQLIFGSILFAQFTWVVFLSVKVYTPQLVILCVGMSLTGIYALWWSFVQHPRELRHSLRAHSLDVPLLELCAAKSDPPPPPPLHHHRDPNLHLEFCHPHFHPPATLSSECASPQPQ